MSDHRVDQAQFTGTPGTEGVTRQEEFEGELAPVSLGSRCVPPNVGGTGRAEEWAARSERSS